MKRLVRYTMVMIEDPDVEYDKNRMLDMANTITECETYPNEPERRKLNEPFRRVSVVCDHTGNVDDDDVNAEVDKLVHVNVNKN